MYGLVQTKGHRVPRPTLIEMSNFTAPVQQEGLLQRARCLTVGDFVDFTAKGVERVHSLAATNRQELHWPEKRAASSTLAQGNRVVLIVGCGDACVRPRALRNQRVERFGGAHSYSLRDSVR